MKKQVNIVQSVVAVSILCLSVACQSVAQQEPVQESPEIYAMAAMQRGEASLLGPYNPNNPPNEPILEVRAHVHCIYEDQRGVFWFGTEGFGVIRNEGDSIAFLREAEGFAGTSVRDIAEDTEGNLWFGTSDGLIKLELDSKVFKVFGTADLSAPMDIYALHFDVDDMLWLGSESGAWKFDGSNFERFELPTTVEDSVGLLKSTQVVRDIIEDQEGQLWFATNSGALVSDGHSIKTIDKESGLPDNAVTSLMQSSDGAVWVGTYRKGLCKLQDGEWSYIKTRSGFERTTVNGLYEDQMGNVWFNIDGACTYRYDGKKLEDLFQKQGCISHTIRCAYQDQKGNIWFGSWLGIFRYDA